MNQRVHLERDGDVAVVVIDNPPINAGSTEVRRGLLEAVESVQRDDGIAAAVLIGAGTTFIAGSDIREFGQPLAAPQLPAVIAAIEACPKPFVAALHGAALGGGFGLPEVSSAPRATRSGDGERVEVQVGGVAVGRRPVFWARERGEAALRADLDWLERVSGPGFVRGDVR
jgi:enoyl-CoA hydratase/carnithine racemase